MKPITGTDLHAVTACLTSTTIRRVAVNFARIEREIRRELDEADSGKLTFSNNGKHMIRCSKTERQDKTDTDPGWLVGTFQLHVYEVELVFMGDPTVNLCGVAPRGGARDDGSSIPRMILSDLEAVFPSLADWRGRNYRMWYALALCRENNINV